MKNNFFVPILLVMVSTSLAAPNKNEQQYSRSPFPVTATKLPVNYQDHNPKELLSAMARQTPAKGRYETEEQYNKRLATLQKQPFLGTLTFKSVIAVVAKPSWQKYDAEKGMSKSYFSIIRNTEEFAPSGVFITQKEKNNNYGVEIANAFQFPLTQSEKNKNSLNFTQNVATDKAEYYEKNLRAAYVGYFEANPFSDASTVNIIDGQPYFNYFNFVRLKVKSIIFFNQKTGTIYGRYNAK